MDEVGSLPIVKRTLVYESQIINGLYKKTTRLELGKNEYGNRINYGLGLGITETNKIIELKKH